MKKKAILITGVAGFIGSRFADYMIENHPEYDVIGIDNLFGGYIENVNDKVLFFQRDLSVDDISDIFNEFDIEYVFHFAAYAAEGLSPFIRKFNYMNNTIATAIIVNECIKHNIKRLVYTSSMSVYGHGQGHTFIEEDTPCPIDPYGVAKYSCEQDIRIAGEQHGLDWCIIRPHNVYGIKQNIWDKYRNVLGIWMYNILHGKEMTVYGNGEQTRAFSYIDDIIPCFWNAATYEKASKEIVNLGGFTAYTINEAVKTLSEITGFYNTVYLEPRHEVKHAIPNGQKSVDILDFKDTISLKEGLTRMWEWAKEQPDRQQYKWPFYELDNKIYSYWK